jgi:hypothetical protein
MLIGSVREFEQRQGEIGADRQVEFGFTEGGNHHSSVADTARNLLSAHIQFRVQPANRQRAVVGILDVELDCEILLQEIAAAQRNAGHRDIGPVEFGRQQRTSA